jgi:hypothetical protein
MKQKTKKNEIPVEIKNQVEKFITDFNRNIIKEKDCYYITRYKGEYLYLDRTEYSGKNPICRLKYNGKIDNWGFEIYKYSDNCYDPEEWFIPGSDEVDGTIEGAMRAGLEAYQ